MKDDVLDIEELACYLMDYLAAHYADVLTERYKITVEDGGSWKLAAPASWGAYLHAPAQLKRDLAQARWKPAFLQRLFGVPLPYGKVYAALKHKK